MAEDNRPGFMTVDFNGLRKNIVNYYNELAYMLAAGKEPDLYGGNDVKVDFDELEMVMNDFRTSILFLAALEKEGEFDSIITDDFTLYSFDDDDDN